jgi:hypothetical protein
MTRMRLTGLVLAAACAALPFAAQAQMMPAPMADDQLAPGPAPRVYFYSGAPVYTPGDEAGMAAAHRNNVESRQYEALLRSNPDFREQRMQRECGSIIDPGARQQCIDTFGDRTASAARYPGAYNDADEE